MDKKTQSPMVPLNVHVWPDQKTALEKRSLAEGVSIGHIVRRIIRESIQPSKPMKGGN